MCGTVGLAAAFACRELNVPLTVVVPTTTKEQVIQKLRYFGAKVEVHGDVWDVANERAMEIVRRTAHATIVHPFDQQSTWTGHASVAHEIFEQWKEKTPPDCVVTVCGGGGLLAGVLEGMDDVGWGQVPIVACETEGASSLAQSLKARRLVTLPAINSVATSLGELLRVL